MVNLYLASGEGMPFLTSDKTKITEVNKNNSYTGNNNTEENYKTQLLRARLAYEALVSSKKIRK